MNHPATRADTRRLPELLAPAGSPAAFRAAVAAGADAIYISGKRFGARKSAPNFSDTEMEEAVRTAHTHGVRVYVTVNTLIHDREIASVTEYLIWLYSIGVDAVLVQDTGVAFLARGMVPGLILHASTQMTIHNTAGVLWAAGQGFRRVVLAREMDLDEIGKIADATRETGTGLEVFVHGALCYSYSGQCLLSSVIGGRSGNRGMCAQPCRKPWVLVTGSTDDFGRPPQVAEVPVRDRFLLSPKDLCTYKSLPRLVRSPVVALKIEGRMKSPEYVAIVVSTYRRALDAIAAGTWKPSEDDERDLLLAFNRGFTAGYLCGDRHKQLMGRDAPDNRGLRIGTVTRYDRAHSLAFIRQESPLLPHAGDGLLISGPQGEEETGFALNHEPDQKKHEFSIRVSREIARGAAVYITSSHDLDTRARQMVAKPPPDLLRPVPVDLRAEISKEGKLVLSGSLERPDGHVVVVSCRPEIVLSPAGSRPLGADTIAQQLKKSGGTPFTVRSLSLTYEGGHFAPLAEINRMRREFFAAAEEQLVASYRPGISDVRHVQHQWQEKNTTTSVPGPGHTGPPGTHQLNLGIYVDSLAGVREAVAAGADTICFEPDPAETPGPCGRKGTIRVPQEMLDEAISMCRDKSIPLFWKFPRITHDQFLDAALPEVPALVRTGLSGIMVEHAGTAAMLRKAVPELMIRGAGGLNIFNHQAGLSVLPLFSQVTLSPELSHEEIAVLIAGFHSRTIRPGTALVVQGTCETMITEDCIKNITDPCGKRPEGNTSSHPFMGIRDEHGGVYPVWTDNTCRTHIGNSRELCLIDHLPGVRSSGIDEVVVDARHRPSRYAGMVTGLYRTAVTWVNTHPGAKEKDPFLTALKGKVERISLGGTTTGHFLRGLKE